MKTKDLLERLAEISAELTNLYGEISAELPQLRVVVDHTRDSEVKKMSRQKFYNSRLRAI